MKRLFIVSVFAFSAILLAKGQPIFEKAIIEPYGENVPTGILTVDSGYIICAVGFEPAVNNWPVIKLFRTDSTGEVTDYRFIGRQGYAFNASPSAAFHKVGNDEYILAGWRNDSAQTETKALLIKLNADLDTLWMREYGEPFRHTSGYQVRQTPDGGYVLIGQTSNYDPSNDFYLIKTDSSGKKKWENTYGKPGFYEVGRNIILTEDSGFILSGQSGANLQDNANGYYIKTDSKGNIEWETMHGTPGDDRIRHIVKSKNGGYIIWGGADTVVSNQDDYGWPSFIAKMDESGNIVWRTFVDKPNRHNFWQVRELEDGSIVFTGQAVNLEKAEGDIGWIGKLDANGNLLWERFYAYQEDLNIFEKEAVFRHDFKPTSDGGFIVTGNIWRQRDTTQPSVNTNHIWLVKLDSMGCLKGDCGLEVGIDEKQPNNPQEATTVIYPNPFSHSALVSVRANDHPGEEVAFRLYDIKGRLLRKQMHELNSVGYGEWRLQRNDLSKGVYIYQVTKGGAKIGQGKMVVE